MLSVKKACRCVPSLGCPVHCWDQTNANMCWVTLPQHSGASTSLSDPSPSTGLPAPRCCLSLFPSSSSQGSKGTAIWPDHSGQPQVSALRQYLRNHWPTGPATPVRRYFAERNCRCLPPGGSSDHKRPSGLSNDPATPRRHETTPRHGAVFQPKHGCPAVLASVRCESLSRRQYFSSSRSLARPG